MTNNPNPTAQLVSFEAWARNAVPQFSSAGKHIRGGEVLWGTPVRPLKEFLEQQAYLSRLPRILAEIKKKIGM